MLELIPWSKEAEINSEMIIVCSGLISEGKNKKFCFKNISFWTRQGKTQVI